MDFVSRVTVWVFLRVIGGGVAQWEARVDGAFLASLYIWEDDESGNLEKFLLVCEFPVTVVRKVYRVGEVVSD